MDFIACLILELLTPVQTWCISFYLTIYLMPIVIHIQMWRMSVMIHVLKCCVNEQVFVSATIMDWCCALHFYLLLCTLTSQRSESRHLCVWVCTVMNVWSLQCCKKAQFHFLWHCITTKGKVCFWAFKFHWSQVWNLCGLANLQTSCLWVAIWVWHTCTT